ncbi:DNA alkylation repair protein [Flagellimonas sp.]|uniref:DNA alkylation repair protein n=1 Tax=Flagellimonas sp. TaxID=2058762 RepID=UPI003F49EB5E
MESLSRKLEVKEQLKHCLTSYRDSGLNNCIQQIETRILSKKIRFPLLEFCGETFFQEIKLEEQIAFCAQIERLKTIGGNVIIGIILQKRLHHNLKESIGKAAEYISLADAWYICDIIGERVFGYALLNSWDQTFPLIQDLANHPSNWVVRSLGAGFHNAIKNGLEKLYVEQLFLLLLSKANVKDKEMKQGMGWAAKTTAKFHPDIIAKFKSEIENTEKTGAWFRTKVRIGLERHQYAKGN